MGITAWIRNHISDFLYVVITVHVPTANTVYSSAIEVSVRITPQIYMDVMIYLCPEFHAGLANHWCISKVFLSVYTRHQIMRHVLCTNTTSGSQLHEHYFFYRWSIINIKWVMSPGEYCCDYYPGTLSSSSTGNGPLTRYVQLRVAHAPGMLGTFSPPPTSRAVMHVGSLNHNGGENVPGIPGACATRGFTYLARCPWQHTRQNNIIGLIILTIT